MTQDWPDQARFIHVLKSLRNASESKLAELVELAAKDAKKFHKHVSTILVKQILVKKSKER